MHLQSNVACSGVNRFSLALMQCVMYICTCSILARNAWLVGGTAVCSAHTANSGSLTITNGGGERTTAATGIGAGGRHGCICTTTGLQTWALLDGWSARGCGGGGMGGGTAIGAGTIGRGGWIQYGRTGATTACSWPEALLRRVRSHATRCRHHRHRRHHEVGGFSSSLQRCRPLLPETLRIYIYICIVTAVDTAKYRKR